MSEANDLGSFPQLPQRCFACAQEDNHAFSAPWGKFTSPVALRCPLQNDFTP